MNHNHLVRLMRQRYLALVLLTLVMGVSASSLVGAAEDPVYEPGFVEWNIDQNERLFVEGLDIEEAVLQRGRTDNAVGSHPVNSGAGIVQIMTVSSEPLVYDINATVNMSVFFSAYIDGFGGPQYCTRIPGDSSFTMIYSVDAGGVPVYDATVTQTVDTDTSNSAMNFSGDTQEVYLSMKAGDVFTLSLSAENRCTGSTIQVQWGAFEQNSGGIIMKGQLYEPKARVEVDAERRAHIEFEPLFPWGVDDVKSTKWELWGPLLEDEKMVKDEELIMETSTAHLRIDRMMPDNKTVWAWSGSSTLSTGDANLEICIQTISGDLNSDCHAFGIIRFEVEKADAGFASSFIFLTLTTVGSLLGFLYVLVQKDELPPLPILAGLVILALLFLPTAINQPNLGSDAVIGDHARVYNTELYDENMQPVMLSQFLDGKDALVVAIALPGTENSIEQGIALNASLDLLGDSIQVIHVLSGMDATTTDVASMKQSLNSSWPVLVDIDETFTSSSPNGTADSILVIDPTMRVVYSADPAGSSEDIVDAVNSINKGGSTSFGAYFSLLFGPGLFLFVLALPREEIEPSVEPLAPGSLWGSIILAGSAGIVLVNLPMMLGSLAPISSNILFWFDIAMMVWLLEMCVVTARRGTPYEADALGAMIHRFFPKAFREWRDVEDMQRDTLIGIWLGWFGWFSFPELFPQGVSSTLLSGISGLFFGVLYLLLIMAFGGAVVLILRFIASWGGSISRLFGEFGAEVFAQFIGWCLFPVALWATVNAVLSAVELGLI
tara:strand:+ start:17310 stop:19640 length:2331 start_codon:yes stop_codon:yes gene_type:complete